MAKERLVDANIRLWFNLKDGAILRKAALFSRRALTGLILPAVVVARMIGDFEYSLSHLGENAIRILNRLDNSG